MKAIAYKQFSDASEIVDIPEGVCLRDAFSVADADAIFLVNGEEVPGDTIPAPGDIVAVRWVPHGIEVIIIGIVAAVALVGAIYAGVTAYEARKKANELEDQMKNMMKGMNDTVQNLPHIRGANNSIATGKSQPYIIGEHIFTPYKLSRHWYKTEGTDGADQFYIDVFECGFNPQVLRELRADEVLLRDFGSGSTPQEGIYQFDESSPFYDADSFIEVSQDGAAFATSDFNVKIVSEQSGKELKKADDDDYEDLIYTLPKYTRSVDVCILFNGLRGYNDEGSHIPRTVVVTPSYSLNNGGSWTDFTFDQNGTPSNTFTRDTMNQLRFVAHADFTYGAVSALTEPILVKLTCSTNKATNTSYDQVYVESIQSLIYDPDASATAGAFVNEKLIDDVEAAVSTRIGLKIKATASNQDKLSKVNIVTAGVARTWDGDEWSISKTPTRNLAAWILEVLTSPTHPASRLADSEIDLDSFGAAYKYYATEGVNVDLVLLDGDEKRSVLAALCELGGCMLYQNIYGETAIAIDAPKENAIAVINTQNLISLDAEKGFNRKADGIRVSYTSRDGGYQPDSYLVMRDGVSRTSESLIRDIDVSGITEHSAIVRYARRLMAIEQLRPKMVKAKVGKEGVYYTPLSKVLVQHPALGNGLGSAEIESVIEEAGYIVGLRLREPILYDSTSPDGFGVIIQAVDDDYCSQIAAAYIADSDGRVSEIEFVTPISSGAAVIPHAGDILSYGYLNLGTFTSITSEMLITGIEIDDAGYLLSLVDYNEAIYDTGTIPDYTPNLTTLGVGPGAPGAPSTSLAEAMLAKEAASAAAAAAARASIYLTSSAAAVTRSRDGSNNPASSTFAAWLPGDTPSPVLGRFRVLENAGAGYVQVYESSEDESSHLHTIGAGLIAVRCDFRSSNGTEYETVASITIGVSLAIDTAPLYWGLLTTAPTEGMALNDYFLDGRAAGSGGGVARYWDGDSWEEALNTMPLWKIIWSDVRVLSDSAAWSRDQGSVIAAANAIFENLFANNVTAAYIFAQQLVTPPGGSQRWYDGVGVNRRCIEVKDGRVNFIDAPDTTPASAEVLAARIGRLGVKGPAILDGDWRANIESRWSDEAIIASTGLRSSYIKPTDGQLRIAYIGSNSYLYERIWSGSAWGSASVITSATTRGLCFIQLKDGELRIAYIRADNSLVEKVWDGSAWGSERIINGPDSADPCCFVTAEGNLRIGYFHAGSTYFYERIWSGSAWGDEALAFYEAYGSANYYQLENGELHIVYRSADLNIVDRKWNGTSWEEPTEITPDSALTPTCVRSRNGEIHVAYIRNGDNYLCERINSNGKWSAEIELVNESSQYPNMYQCPDGELRIAYQKNTGHLVERTLQRYARIGAGIIEQGEDENGYWEKWGNGRLECYGRKVSDASGGAAGRTVVTLPAAYLSGASYRVFVNNTAHPGVNWVNVFPSNGTAPIFGERTATSFIAQASYISPVVGVNGVTFEWWTIGRWK